MATFYIRCFRISSHLFNVTSTVSNCSEQPGMHLNGSQATCWSGDWTAPVTSCPGPPRPLELWLQA